MNKTTLKSVMIAIVAVAINVSIINFTKKLQYVSQPIPAYNVAEHIEQRAVDEITGKDFLEDHDAYLSIMKDLKTETSVKLADGSWNMNSGDISNALQTLFAQYAPVLVDFGKDYFTKSSWDDRTVNCLLDDGQWLQKMEFAESGSELSTDLAAVVKYAGEYKAARQVVSSASKCASVGEIATIKQKAASFLHEPLTNNIALVKDLKAAESVARASVVSNIASFCNGVASKWRGYGTYVKWYAAYEQALGRISECGKKLGQNSALSQAKAALENADRNALNYYN